MSLPEELKILLAEDNFINQKVAVLTLKHLNLNCDLASNGLEAVEMFQQKFYDLVLMDVRMPVLDGLEATKLIRSYEESANLPRKSFIIALTANEPSEFGQNFQDVGMDGFMEKPLMVEKFVELLTKITVTQESRIQKK